LGGGLGAEAAGAAAAVVAEAAAAFTSSPSAAITAITWLTGTSALPSGTTILASVPSSAASTSMVALSVSISAITSPDLILSPSFLSHLARLPFSIVGDSAGIRMLIGMARSAFAAYWFGARLCACLCTGPAGHRLCGARILDRTRANGGRKGLGDID